jgi:SNF2 family DNA or RNA helicase
LVQNRQAEGSASSARSTADDAPLAEGSTASASGTAEITKYDEHVFVQEFKETESEAVSYEEKIGSKTNLVADMLLQDPPAELLLPQSATNIPLLPTGDVFIPPDPNGVRKLLVFSLHSESLLKLQRMFLANRLTCFRLAGTTRQRSEVVRDFRDCTEDSLLLVTSPKDCGGIHMPYVTHVVLYYNPTDLSVFSQVIARAHRRGRERSLTVYILCNEDELHNAPEN